MNILKVFVDEPASLNVLTEPGSSTTKPLSLDELRSGTPGAPSYGRAYIAGTRLPDQDGAALRIGATALDDVNAFVSPLLLWAGERQWTLLRTGGNTTWPIGADAAQVLSNPVDVAVLASADGPVDSVRLAGLVGGEGRESNAALRAALDYDESLAIFVPEPAHDGYDWSLVARSPLRDPLIAALKAAPTPPDTRVFVVPHQKARSEHTFYFEQWSLDAPPAGTEEIG